MNLVNNKDYTACKTLVPMPMAVTEWFTYEILPVLCDKQKYKREAAQLRSKDSKAVLNMMGDDTPAGYACGYLVGGDTHQAITWAAVTLNDESLFTKALEVARAAPVEPKVLAHA